MTTFSLKYFSCFSRLIAVKVEAFLELTFEKDTPQNQGQS